MKRIAYFITLLLLQLLFFSCQTTVETVSEKTPKHYDPVFYHVVQRSFYDSNGDQHGDLKGLESKLDYLEELGVNSVLLLPLYKSIYYHNYFADDFETIDSTLGSKEEYLSLVKALHKRDMRFFMDMEIHYVTKDHEWFQDSYGNPESAFDDYIVYNNEENTAPESIIFDITALEGFDGRSLGLTTLNLHSPEVQDYFQDLFLYWVDPNGDGNFEDGVDGYRIDHMMDDLDWKNKFTNLFEDFWVPIFDTIRAINPDLKIIAEQANWTETGQRYMMEAKVDMTFGFKMMNALLKMDAARIEGAYDSLFSDLPEGCSQILFLENHDTHRFASEVNDKDKMRAGAALVILQKGAPLIYYGQELGMRGEGGFGVFGMTDANDIPRREAFEWQAEVESPGHALWYKNSGPWWDQTNLKSNDGISVEEQVSDSLSLLSHYRRLLHLRASNPVLQTGDQEFVNLNSKLLQIARYNEQDSLVVVVNLEDQQQKMSNPKSDLLSGETVSELQPYQTIVYDARP